MKLIIQIPCFNEEKTLPITLKALPKSIDGIDEIEVIIIDDGSSDKTVEVAKEFGVKNIFSLNKNYGLARAFSYGLNKAIELGADIVVNTDADNQYCADDVEKIVIPILNNKADMVVGERPISDIKHFSISKKMLQKLGSKVMSLISGVKINDAPSGFRAFSRRAAMSINVFDNYTYTLETIIQANAKGLVVENVPIRVNKEERPSRLISNIFVYILRSILTMTRMFIVYRPFRFFATISAIFLILGLLTGGRFLYYYFVGEGSGHVQSLILASILIITGVQTFVVAIASDLLSINRKLLEDIQMRLKNK